MGIESNFWGETVQFLIEQHHPEMILITLRNTDSLDLKDYQKDEKTETRNGYFPIERTKELIGVIRSVSNLKIAVGGFGFTLLHKELMTYLQPDYGVVYGPDDFSLVLKVSPSITSLT